MTNPYKLLQTKVQSQSKLVVSNEKSLVKATRQMRCMCVHRDSDGGIALLSPNGGSKCEKSKVTGAPLYTCRICGKKIDVSSLTQEDFDKSLDTLDRLYDIAKIRLDFKSSKDRDMLTRIAKTQFELTETTPSLYSTVIKGGKKKDKNRGQYSGDVRVSR